MSHKNHHDEGNSSSHSSPPLTKVQKFAQAGELSLPCVKDKGINEFVKKVQAIRNAPEIDDWLWKIAAGRSEQAKKK
jgi:hypothetical protein